MNGIFSCRDFLQPGRKSFNPRISRIYANPNNRLRGNWRNSRILVLSSLPFFLDNITHSALHSAFESPVGRSAQAAVCKTVPTRRECDSSTGFHFSEHRMKSAERPRHARRGRFRHVSAGGNWGLCSRIANGSRTPRGKQRGRRRKLPSAISHSNQHR